MVWMWAGPGMKQRYDVVLCEDIFPGTGRLDQAQKLGRDMGGSLSLPPFFVCSFTVETQASGISGCSEQGLQRFLVILRNIYRGMFVLSVQELWVPR
jgi:hypothetical protein